MGRVGAFISMFLRRFGRTITFAAFVVLFGNCSWAWAQVVPPSEDASRLRERFTQPPPPQAQQAGPTIPLRSTTAPDRAREINLKVRRVVIRHSTVYQAAELDQLGADLIGKTVSLQAVYDLAARITTKYGQDGYVLSRAIVPPQELNKSGATVYIDVVEGYVDRVQWPESVKRYRDVFSHYTAKITATRPANIKVIERYLLLANDLPGLSFKSTLKPSDAATGAATLVIEMAEKPVFGQAHADNRGSAGRGPFQYALTGGVANVLGQHESVAITYASVPNSRELQYVAADFRTVLNGEGLTYFASPYFSAGKPNIDILRAIDYRSRAVGLETGLSFPVIRSREQNLTLVGLAFATDSVGDVSAGRLSDDRLRGVRLRTLYDVADGWSGINQVVATYSQGIAGFGSTGNDNTIASRLAGRVDFSKFDGSVSRLQPLYGGFSIYAAVEGQYGLSALLVPEQCSYGGQRIGRAFDPSALVGDRCISELAELRYDIASGNPRLTQSQVYGFVDHGDVYVVNAASGTPAHLQGASAGAGVRLAWDNSLFGSVEVARHIQGDDTHGWRSFFSLTARY